MVERRGLTLCVLHENVHVHFVTPHNTLCFRHRSECVTNTRHGVSYASAPFFPFISATSISKLLHTHRHDTRTASLPPYGPAQARSRAFPRGVQREPDAYIYHSKKNIPGKHSVTPLMFQKEIRIKTLVFVLFRRLSVLFCSVSSFLCAQPFLFCFLKLVASRVHPRVLFFFWSLLKWDFLTCFLSRCSLCCDPEKNENKPSFATTFARIREC